MIDFKFYKKNINLLKQALTKRNSNINANNIIQLDAQVRELQTQSQTLSAQRNKLSKEIGLKKAKGENADDLLQQVSKTKNLEDELVEKTKGLEDRLKLELSFIPNVLDDSVPYGKTEEENVEVRKVGEIKQFDFTPKEHFELGENLQQINFDKAAEMSGSRFNILSHHIAKLERALINFMLDLHTSKNGYTEYSLPTLVKEQALWNTGQLPKFSEDLFKTTQDHWLISTTEVTLTNLFAKQTFTPSQLPQRVTGVSLCYRSEAGSAGKDTKGILRQHQFYKVELVSITTPSQSFAELERMLGCAEEVLQLLQLPYRVLLLCSADTGFASAKTYDIEVWLPGQNKYREISSCSNCTDFQARRMQAKVTDNNSSNFAHTLNGSGLAVGRTIIAILENYQNKDGSVTIPQVLVPYMGGLTVIK